MDFGGCRPELVSLQLDKQGTQQGKTQDKTDSVVTATDKLESV